jgi:hypothetical protein
MKTWQDKALENSFPKETTGQKVKDLFKSIFALLGMVGFIGLVVLWFFVDIPLPQLGLRSLVVIGVILILLQLERIIQRLPPK